MHDENAREAILEVVSNQLKPGVAPEVLAEFNRLVAEGIGKQKAKELIGMILACHVASSMKHSRNFDYPAYIDELKKLPRYNLDREL